MQLKAEAESESESKATSHVRQTVAMSQIFIARLQEIQRVHIPHSVLSGTVGCVARMEQKQKYNYTKHIPLICPTVSGPRWTLRRIACLAARSSQLAHICLSIWRAVLLGLVACPVACLVACCMWQQRGAATTAYSVCN